MMHLAYLAALLVSLFCMTLLDRRFTLFFWRDWRRATVVMVIGLVFFVIWDFAGISLDIFYRGDSPWMTGIEIAPEMPVEELFFLALLCYVTMVAYGGARALFGGLSSGLRSGAIAPAIARSAPTEPATEASAVSKPSAKSNSGGAQ